MWQLSTSLAVSKIVKGGRRLRSQMFAAGFGKLGKGNDKGKVEGLVGYVRRSS
jgi:hypothetical protein